jgi:hypothetical protein
MMAQRIQGKRLGEIFNSKIRSIEDSYALLAQHQDESYAGKLFLANALEQPDVDAFWSTLSDHTVVGLVRRDLESLVLSKLLAMITGIRQRVMTNDYNDTKILINLNNITKTSSNIAVTDISIIYGPEHTKHVKACIEEAIALGNEIKNKNIQPVYYYESLTGNPNIDIPEFGTTVADGFITKHQKIYPDKDFKRQCISNYAEFKQEFDSIIESYQDRLAETGIDWIYNS